MLRGKINGIWLTQPKGALHPAIKNNFCKNLQAAKKHGFEMVLWTNLTELDEAQASSFRQTGVTLQDHSICAKSRFYPYFKHFLELGIAGDRTAFALASDILRMAILEMTPDDQYYIYIDPNDVNLFNLEQNLSELDKIFQYNNFGFSFFIMPLKDDSFHMRNDLLIAKKSKNPKFFNLYLTAYLTQLQNEYTRYSKPKTDGEAQDLAVRISNQITNSFFYVKLTKPMATVKAAFGEFETLFGLINSAALLYHKREMEHANTWLPLGELAEERLSLQKSGFVSDVDFAVPQKPVTKDSALPAANTNSSAVAAPTQKKPGISTTQGIYSKNRGAANGAEKNEFGFKKGFLM